MGEETSQCLWANLLLCFEDNRCICYEYKLLASSSRFADQGAKIEKTKQHQAAGVKKMRTLLGLPTLQSPLRIASSHCHPSTMASKLKLSRVALLTLIAVRPSYSFVRVPVAFGSFASNHRHLSTSSYQAPNQRNGMLNLGSLLDSDLRGASHHAFLPFPLKQIALPWLPRLLLRLLRSKNPMM